MIRAKIQWKDGTESSIVANDVFDLLAKIGNEPFTSLETEEISLEEMRQGKDNGKKVRKNAQPV